MSHRMRYIPLQNLYRYGNHLTDTVDSLEVVRYLAGRNCKAPKRPRKVFWLNFILMQSLIVDSMFKRKPKMSDLTSMVITEAVAQGLVEVRLYGVREGDPSKAKLKIRRLSAKPFKLVIPRGTNFRPLVTEAQGND